MSSLFLQRQAERRAARNARGREVPHSEIGLRLIEEHKQMMAEYKSLRRIHGERFNGQHLKQLKSLQTADQITFRQVPGSWFTITKGEMDFDLIKSIAKEAASTVMQTYVQSGGDETWARGKAIELCHLYKIDPPDPKKHVWQRLLRFMDEKWWHRKLRRRLPALTLEFHRQQQTRYEYCDKNTIRALSTLKYESVKWMDRQTLIPEDTESDIKLPLIQVASSLELSKQALFFSKCAALQKQAVENGQTAAMITITVPGSWRAGRDEYHTIRECRRWLTKIENRVAATKKKIEKKEKRTISVHMVKATQPHRDGTPHRHIFIVGTKEDIQTIYEIYRIQALKECGDEAGALEHRTKIDYAGEIFDFKDEDSTDNRINFAQYVMRYCQRFALRDINSLDPDNIKESDILEILEKRKEETWFMATGTRRYSFSGLPPDYVWYSIYRQTHRDYFSHCKMDDEGKPIERFFDFVTRFYPEQLHDLILAVNAGDYYAFWQRIKTLGFERIQNEKRNSYEESIKQTIGCVILGHEFLLKDIAWKIVETDVEKENDERMFDDMLDPDSLLINEVGVIYYRPRGSDSLDHGREKDAIPPL